MGGEKTVGDEKTTVQIIFQKHVALLKKRVLQELIVRKYLIMFVSASLPLPLLPVLPQGPVGCFSRFEAS